MAGIKDKAAVRRQQSASTRRKNSNSDSRVVRFPQLKGKVVRSARFTHDDYEHVLAIEFRDRSILYFDIRPEPLLLPLDIGGALVGWSSGKRRLLKSWPNLG